MAANVLRLVEVFALLFRGKIVSLNAVHNTSDCAGGSRFKSPLYWLSFIVIFLSPSKRLPGLYSEMGDVDFTPNPLKFTFHYYSRASDDANPYPALNLCR
jgi:hypothetical protein